MFPITKRSFSGRNFAQLQQIQAIHQQTGKVALVQGASRGLGLEFVKQLLDYPQTKVIATCRTPITAAILQRLAWGSDGRLEVVELDVTKPDSIQKAYDAIYPKHQHLDLLINAAGVLHIGKEYMPGKEYLPQNEYMPETSISKIKPEFIELNFRTNAIGPILVCQTFQKLLSNAEQLNGATDDRPAVCVNMSARVGSIGDNRLGGWYSYRSSKAALNQLTKTMAIEFSRKYKIACIALHPGTCDTDLTKPFQKNVQPEKLFAREQGVKQLLQIIDGLSMKDNGRYIAWDGSDIPW